MPVSASGVASFDMSASLEGGDADANTNVVKDPEIVLVKYDETKTYRDQDAYGESNNWTWTKNYSAQVQIGTNGQYWTNYSGYAGTTNWGSHEGAPYWGDSSVWWTATNSLEVDSDGYVGPMILYYDPGIWDNDLPTTIPDTDLTSYCASCGPTESWMTHYFANNARWHWDFGNGNTQDAGVIARTRMKLFTGGKAGVNRMNLFCISVGGEEYGKPPGTWVAAGYGGPWCDVPIRR